MGSLFQDVACLQDDDLVCSEDGVQAMGDGDDGPSLHQALCGFLEQGFGLRVEAGGGFVQDKDRRIFQEGAGEGETLGLSAAETRAAFADDCLIFFRQRFDEFMQVRGFCSFHDFLVRCIRLAKANICCDGIMEKIRFLRHPGNVGEELVIGDW